jgi:hypothetical protein
MNTNMTPEQALQILSDATDPAAAYGKLSRSGFTAVDQALSVIAKLITTPNVPNDNDTES